MCVADPGFRSPVLFALHLPAHQDLHSNAVQCLPGWLSYPCPTLSEVRCPLYDLVAGEDDQIEVSAPPSVLSSGQCSIHTRGVVNLLARITPATITSAES